MSKYSSDASPSETMSMKVFSVDIVDYTVIGRQTFHKCSDPIRGIRLEYLAVSWNFPFSAYSSNQK